MHKNMGKPIICPMDKKKMPSICIEKYPGLCTLFIKTSDCYLIFIVYHSYLDLGTLWFLLKHFISELCSGGYNKCVLVSFEPYMTHIINTNAWSWICISVSVGTFLSQFKRFYFIPILLFCSFTTGVLPSIAEIDLQSSGI